MSWVLQTTPSATVDGIAFGAGLFVAVGPGGTVITSPDGITWTTQASGNSGNYRVVRYANGTFVACDIANNTNGFMTSPDGINWTTRAIPFAQEIWNVAFGNGVWCASRIRSGTAQNILRSTDNGVSWTIISTPVPATSNVNWTGLTYGNGVWVATSNRDITNNIMTSSDDGLTWVLRTKSTNVPVWAVAFGNGRFIASSSSTAQYFISTTGITWTQFTFPLSRQIRELVYSNGIWVATGISVSSDSAFYSTDASSVSLIPAVSPTWTVMTTPTGLGGWSSVCFGNGRFVSCRFVSGGTTNAIMTWTGLTNASFLLNVL